MPRVTIISASIGAGHDGVADELDRRLSAAGTTVHRLDFLDLLAHDAGRGLRRAYGWQLRHADRTWGWLLAALQQRDLAAIAAGLSVRAATARTLAALDPAPDVVVSTYPMASQVLGVLRTTGQLGAPVVTYLTDMSVHPLWIAAGVDLHLAVHPEAATQANRLGARTCLVTPAVADQFHRAYPPAHRHALRTSLAIPTDRPVALVVGGSWGVGGIAAAMSDIVDTGVAVPVALCGTNERLRAQLTRRGFGPALGWVDQMGALLRACDVVVQNAGGLTSLQALAAGVPVVSYRCIAGHGVTNAEALERAGYARWARHRSALGPALAAALAGPAPAVVAGAEPAEVITSLVRLPVRA